MDVAQTPQAITTSRYYSAAFAAFGANAQGVDWASDEGQILRFEQLDLIWGNTPDSSICDFGCGYGAYAEHLVFKGHRGPYLGVDVSHAMVAHAQEVFLQHSKVNFRLGHKPENADFIVASGTFNVITTGTRTEWDRYVWRMIECMIQRATVGIGFNLILEPSTNELVRQDLYWASPAEVHQRLLRMGLEAQVIGDYGLHEATYLAWKDRNGSVS